MKNVFIIFGLALIPTPLLAAGGGHHDPHITDLAWFWFNFLVYCGVLYYLLRKPMANYWHERWQGIEAQITKGERALKVAEEELRAAREQMESLDSSIKALETQIKAEAAQEVSATSADAKDQIKRIEKQLEMAKESEQQASHSELQEQLARKVLEKTEKDLRTHFDSDKDKVYRSAALDSLEAIAATLK